MSQKTLCVLLIAILTIASTGAEPKDKALEWEHQLKSAMQAREYAKTIIAADKTLALSPKNADFFRYMKVLAYYHSNSTDDCRKVLGGLLKNESGTWYRKARFLTARIHLQQKAYEKAEQIYADEARRLHAAGRKKEIAQTYINFAQALSKEPAAEDLSALKPDYYKAHTLYQKALEVKPGEELSEEISFRLGEMMYKAKNWYRAINAFEQYLTKHDPDWHPNVGPFAMKKHVDVVGKFRAQARYLMGECQLKRGSYQQARRSFEELTRFLQGQNAEEQNKYMAKAMWQITRSYRIPNPSSSELDKAISSLTKYLAQYPKSRHSVQAAYEIGACYIKHGRTVEAVSAVRDFIAGKNYEVLQGVAKEAGEETPLEMHDRLRKEATYKLGKLYFDQNHYNQAKEIWQQYTAQFPNGPHWSLAQQGILDSEYKIGEDLLAARKYEQARVAWQQFMSKYPLDSRTRRILYTFGEIKHQFALAEKKRIAKGQLRQSKETLAALFNKTIGEWEKLISKYPQSDEAHAALFFTGKMYEEQLMELKKALETYKKVRRGQWYSKAQQRINQMTKKHLAISTERVFRTDETAKIKVHTRNIEKLTLRIYALDMKEYFRKEHRIRGIEKLDLALIEPDKRWEVKVDNYKQYLPIEQHIPIEFKGAGVYAVNISSEDYEATTLLIRSDLDFILKTSRKELLVFVQNMKDKKAAADVDIWISDGNKVIYKGKSNEQGVLLQNLKELKDSSQISILLEKDGSIASNLASLSGLGFSLGLSAKGYVFTDRPAYKPGETVHIRGIIRDVVDGSYSVPQDKDYLLSIFDSAGRLLTEEKVKLSEFGTGHGSFQLSADAPVGEYRAQFVDAKGKQNFQGNFQVSHLKLEKIKLSLKFDNRVVFRGEKIEATYQASYYYGLPVADKKLRYTLPDGSSFVKKTDDKGQFVVTFDTARMTPGNYLTFRGQLVEESISVSERVFLANQGFNLSVGSSRSVVLSEEPVEITVKAMDSTDKPVAKELQVKVYRQVTVEPDPVLASLPWHRQGAQSYSEVKIAEKTITTDGKTGIARISFTLKDGGKHIIRVSGKDRFENPVSQSTSLFVSGKDDATKLRIFTARQHWRVGENLEWDIHSRLGKGIALVTFEGETFLGYRIVELSNGKNSLKQSLDHKHFPNFRLSVSFMEKNNFYETHQPFTVERNLQVKVKFDKDHYAPGEKTKIKVTATDHTGKPVKAELSLALLDQALLAVFPEKRVPIVDFFQKDAKREFDMRTATSCTFSYEGVTAKVNKELAKEALRLVEMEKKAREEVASGYYNHRQRRVLRLPKLDQRLNAMPNQAADEFEGDFDEELEEEEQVEAPGASQKRDEVAAQGWWAPAIVTDENGQAEVELVMPEKITAWQLNAVGCSEQTLVGEQKGSVITRKQFFVEAKLPQVFVEGDKPKIIGRVHNLSVYSGKAILTLEVDFGHRKVIQPKTLQVKANGVTEVIFDDFVVAPGAECKVHLSAETQDGKLTDAITHATPVRPWGMEYADYKSGKAESSTTVFVTLPQKRYISRWMSVVVGPDMQRTIFDMVYQTAYVQWDAPVFSSPADDLLACVAALEYAAQSKTQQPDDYYKLLQRARALTAALVVSQNRDGGWSLAKSSSSDAIVTARSAWALAQAKNNGVKVHGITLTNAVRYLKKTFARASHNDNETKALIQYSLALLKQSDFAYGNRLYRQRFSMNNSALSYTALLLESLGKKEMAGEILDVLESRKTSAGGLWATKGNSTWTANAVENTALAILAFEKVRPTSPLVKKGVDFLLSLRQCGSFYPSHSRGVAIYALALYYHKAGYAGSDYKLEIVVNGKVIQTVSGRKNSPSAMLEIPGTLISAGQNRVRFEFEGNGVYTYSVALRGFSPDIKDPKSWDSPFVSGRIYRHAPLEYNGRSINVTSSSTVSSPELGQIIHAELNFYRGYARRAYYVVEEPIPAGMVVLKETVRGNFSHFSLEPGKILCYYTPSQYPNKINYHLAAYAPGHYRVLPAVIRDAHKPGAMRIGKATEITVMGPGESSKDNYKMNKSELYTLGRLYFEDRNYGKSLEMLSELVKQSPGYNQKEVARMLLWIYTQEKFYNAQKIVEYFEILKEKYPELYIPFERILIVGNAYEDIKEFERAYLVFHAIIESSFEEEAKVGGVLEDQGQFLGATDYMQNLWRDYHDSAYVAQAHFGLSQAVYAKSSKPEQLKNNFRLTGPVHCATKVPTKQELLVETISLLHDFLAFYPQSPQADDAAFSLASAYLDLDQFEQLVQLSKEARERYVKSPFVSSFQYMETLGYFSMHDYQKAIRQAKIVSDGKSKDKDYATYILGQVYHAQSKAKNAIETYKRIQEKFPDAKDSIEYFEKRYIRVPEVSEIRPGKQVEVKLEYRNIEEAHFLVYRVDLMKLYLQKKNLSGITKVRLSGISPALEKRIKLNNKDYRDNEQNIPLKLEKEGAYLVICRGDDLFTSGLVLITPLRIEIQEDTGNGSVRVNLIDATNNERPEGVHVKVVGSGDQKFVSGETDLRGLFVAGNVRGKTTVIARDKKSRYAFYRGEQWLGAKNTSTRIRPTKPSMQYNFRSNLEYSNRAMQEMNVNKLRKQMRKTKKGVQVEQAK